MAPIMEQKVNRVLDRVKEPETGLSIAQPGLVERLRYVERNSTPKIILTRTIAYFSKLKKGTLAPLNANSLFRNLEGLKTRGPLI